MINIEHTHGLLDANNVVFDVLVIATHDENLLQQITEMRNAVGQVCELEISNPEAGVFIGGTLINNTMVGFPDFPSWTLNMSTLKYEAPTPKPDSGFWIWNEEKLQWEETPFHE